VASLASGWTSSDSVEPPQACNAVVAHPKRPNFNAFRRLNVFIPGSAMTVNRFVAI
jgi:hypothetical protein